MNIHTPLYRELYKYTNHYKETEMRKYLSRFRFNEPSVSTDGLNFINSTCLHTVNDLELKNSRVYFENISSPKSRYMNKKIRICNIPFSQLPLKGDIIKSLNQYLLKNIEIDKYTGDYSCPNIESLGLRAPTWNNNYPDLEYIYKVGTGIGTKSNRESISKYLYGLQFNSLEFFEATGILVTVFRNCKSRSVNSNIEYEKSIFGKLSNFNKLYDGLNIRISIQSNSMLEIDFTETLEPENGYELYDFEYEVDICSSVKNIEKINDNNDGSLSLWKYRNKSDIGTNDSHNLYDYDYSEKIEFKDELQVSYNELDNTTAIYGEDYIKIHNLPTMSKEYNMITVYSHIGDEIIWSKLINPRDLKYDDHSFIIYESSTPIDAVITATIISFKESNNESTVKELHDIIDSENYYIPDSTDIITDEKNLIKSLPFALQKILEDKCTFNVKNVDKIMVSSIVLYNEIPCVKYSINNKHDSIMFFKDNKLLSPSYIEDKNDTTNIYIELSQLVNITPSIRNIVYGRDKSTKYININSNFYIVYDTEKLFIENMRYNIKSVYLYLDKESTTRYSIRNDIDNNNLSYSNQLYMEDENGDYILYNDNYLEIATGTYALINGQYINAAEDYSGTKYIKVKTNEYLLPLNKDIDPNKIVIVIEDNVDYSDETTKFIRDIEGCYIYLSEARYYRCYNFKNNIDKYYKLTNEKFISIVDYNSSLIDGEETIYHIVDGTIYYNDYNNYYNTSDVYIKIDNNFYPYNSNTYIENGKIYENITNSEYMDGYYIKRDPGYIIPPYYYDEDIRYRRTGHKLVQLANIFNLRKMEDIVAIDSYVNSIDEMGNQITVKNQTYTKESLIHSMIMKIYNVDIDICDRYYLDGEEYKLYTSSLYRDNIELYYKTLSDTYIKAQIIDDHKKEISEFVNMNRLYKFSLINGEVLDGGVAETDEYIEYIDFGRDFSFEQYIPLTESEKELCIQNEDKLYINIDDRLVEYDPIMHESYSGNFYSVNSFSNEIDLNNNKDQNNNLILDDDYPIYDFNFSSPYSILDSNIKAYRIDSSYSKYFINNEDEYLAYKIPNQLINSENRMLTFLNGKMTDEYIINKKLYSRLFNGDTILSFSDDPDDVTGNDYVYSIKSDGEYYYDSNSKKYVYDPNRDKSIVERVSSNTYYKLSSSESDEYIESSLYDSNDIVNIVELYELLPDGNYELYTGDITDENIRNSLYYKLKNGHFVSVKKYKINPPIVNYNKYFELINTYNDSYFIETREYYEYITAYSKSISSVYMCNMKNMILYQNQNGIKYDSESRIFTMSSSFDDVVRNERQLYKDIYFLPLSTKYMLFFVNGRFANKYIKIITPTKFIIENPNELLNSNVINQIQVYAYDKYLYDLYRYKEFYLPIGTTANDSTNVPIFDSITGNDIPNTIDYTIYRYNDTLWRDHSNELIDIYKDQTVDIQYIPKDTSYSAYTDLLSLYEIFGKFILNKYDIDNDSTLYDEIREYFGALFDEDNRMRLELIRDASKRKYIY